MLLKKARERCQDLSEEEKNEKQQYVRERYKNLLKDEKQRLVEYRKKRKSGKINCFTNKEQLMFLVSTLISLLK